MTKRIVVIDGHPDSSDARFVHALATAYQEAATQAGHQVRVLTLAEQVMRPGFAFGAGGEGKLPKKLLAGKSARIIVTMGMPALFYRWYFRAQSLKSLERNILRFTGFGPVRASVVGSVQAMTAKKRNAWLERVRQLGSNGT